MDVTLLSLSELEQLLDRYPWFTLARKEYVLRHRPFGEADLREAAARAGIFVLSRSEFLAEITGKRLKPTAPVPQAPAPVADVSPVVEAAPVVTEKAPAEAPALAETPADSAAAPAPEMPAPPRKVYVVGGDYFDKEDFKALGEAGAEIDSKLDFNPITATLESISAPSAPAAPSAAAPAAALAAVNPVAGSAGEPASETLARIYADQGLYDRAIAVYEKLILLDPEKSAYFAALIDKLNQTKQQ